MSAFLDDLARSLAQPMPRRRALGLLGRALLAAALPGVLRPRPARADSCFGCTDPGQFLCRNTAGPVCAFRCCLPGDLCCTATHGATCCPRGCYTCGSSTTTDGRVYPVCVLDPGTFTCPRFGQVPGFCCKTGETCCGEHCCEEGGQCCSGIDGVVNPFCCGAGESCCFDRCCQKGYQCCLGSSGVPTCCQPTRRCRNGKCVCKNPKARKKKCGTIGVKCCKGETCCGGVNCCSTDETCCGGLICCAAGEVCSDNDGVPECLPPLPLTA